MTVTRPDDTLQYKLTNPLFDTSTFDNVIENACEVFTSMRSFDVSKRKQSGPQDQFTVGLVAHTLHDEVRRGAKK